MKSIIYKFALPIVTLIFGIATGIIIRDFPKFKLNYDLKITDVIGNLATIGVGVFVPLIVKKIIEDNKSIKLVLINEIDNYKQQISNIYDVFNQCYSSNITRKNKDNIALQLETLDSKYEQMKQMIVGQFAQNTEKELNSISEQQTKIWKLLTGHNLTAETVTNINQNIYDEAQKLNRDLQILIVNLKSKIHTL